MKLWDRLVGKLGRKRAVLLVYLTGVALVALTMRVLMAQKLYHSSILYVLIPFLISVAITFFRSPKPLTTRWRKYLSHIATATTILLSTSILIGEGFICILFFAPIYLFIVTLTYIASAIANKNSKYSMIFPALVLAMSVEGINPDLSLPRHTYAQVKQTTSLSPEQLKNNIAKEFTLDKKRYWLLSIFPMPYQIDAGSLNPGDVHTVYTRYHRWFFTNTHEGKAELLIEDVGEHHIKTRVLSDTTYFSNYLSGTGTEILLEPNATGGTDITLRLHYRRNLDPAWYFHPLQKFGVSKMGELIMSQLMLRDEP